MKTEEFEAICPPALESSSGDYDNSNTSSPCSERSTSQPMGSESAPRKTKTGKEREKETRKRTRVNAEQLVHLERFFAIDRSPTASRRKDISDLLGMQERQTQIWFQNRRAKAKAQQERARSQQMEQVDQLQLVPAPPSSAPHILAPACPQEVDLSSLIHEDESVTIIPCTDLTIGSWRRISTAENHNDLVAYVCAIKCCLTWYIHSAGYGFKMEMPFDSIVETQFTKRTSAPSLASFIVSRPPLFYLEQVSHSQPEGPVVRSWTQCSDWTEGQQASTVMRHDLVGSSMQLTHLLASLQASSQCPIFSSSPSPAASHPLPPSPVILQVAIPSPPPMSGIPVKIESPLATTSPLSVEERGQRNFYPIPPPLSPENTEFVPDRRLRRMASGSSTSTASYPPSTYSSDSPHGYDSPMFTDVAEPVEHSIPEQPESSSIEDYGVVQAAPPRQFVAQEVTPSFYQDDSLHQSYGQHVLRRQASGTFSVYSDECPSPAVLTAPYYPPFQTQDMCGMEYANLSPQVMISGLLSFDHGSEMESIHNHHHHQLWNEQQY